LALLNSAALSAVVAELPAPAPIERLGLSLNVGCVAVNGHSFSALLRSDLPFDKCRRASRRLLLPRASERLGRGARRGRNGENGASRLTPSTLSPFALATLRFESARTLAKAIARAEAGRGNVARLCQHAPVLPMQRSRQEGPGRAPLLIATVWRARAPTPARRAKRACTQHPGQATP
jgi:hypothetical protein